MESKKNESSKNIKKIIIPTLNLHVNFEEFMQKKICDK